MTRVLEPFVLALTGTSLTTGRLSAGWRAQLAKDLPNQPEAIGPVRIYDMGKGGQTSVWGLSNAPLISALKPTHILAEGFAINDCVDTGSGPAVSRAQHILNLQAMVAEWQANVPGVDITIQTMSPVSATDAFRPQLANYYGDEIATATTLGVRTLDNYAGWPKPLPQDHSNGGVPGSAAWGAGVVWTPNGNLTFADGGLTVGNSNGTNWTDPATTTKSAGKFNFRVRQNAGVNVVGLLQPGGQDGTGGVGIGRTGDGKSYGYDCGDGWVYNAGAKVTKFAALVPGDTLGVLADYDLGKLFFAVNDVWFNCDPAQGLGGVALAAATYSPAVSLGSGGSVTADFTLGVGDGLHPVWVGAVDTYLYPNVLAWARARMAEHWT